MAYSKNEGSTTGTVGSGDKKSACALGTSQTRAHPTHTSMTNMPKLQRQVRRAEWPFGAWTNPLTTPQTKAHQVPHIVFEGRSQCNTKHTREETRRERQVDKEEREKERAETSKIATKSRQ